MNSLPFEHIFQKGQRIVCSELQAFHLLSHTSSVLQLFRSEVLRLLTHSLLEVVGIIQFCVISTNLVCFMGYLLNQQANSTKANYHWHALLVCLWHLLEENDQGMMGCQNQDTPFYLSVFLVYFFFPSALFSINKYILFEIVYSILLINRSLSIELCGLCIKQNLCNSVFESETNSGSVVQLAL